MITPIPVNPSSAIAVGGRMDNNRRSIDVRPLLLTKRTITINAIRINAIDRFLLTTSSPWVTESLQKLWVKSPTGAVSAVFFSKMEPAIFFFSSTSYSPASMGTACVQPRNAESSMLFANSTE